MKVITFTVPNALDKSNVRKIKSNNRIGKLNKEKIINKAEITHALCDSRLLSELEPCMRSNKFLKYLIPLDSLAYEQSSAANHLEKLQAQLNSP